MQSFCEQFCKYALMSPPEKVIVAYQYDEPFEKKNFFLKNFEHLKIKKKQFVWNVVLSQTNGNSIIKYPKLVVLFLC